MNTDDHDARDRNRQAGESDLGPEPDWLMDDAAQNTETFPDRAEPVAPPQRESRATSEPIGDEAEADEPQREAPPQREFRAGKEPIEADAVAVASSPAVVKTRRSKPWFWSAVPLLVLVVTAIIAWFGSSQGLNSINTWSALRFQHAGLLPARWSMLMWWIVLPLLAVFLVYSALPAGREITRIKRTGPLLVIGLIGACLWVFAQHWRWEEISVVAMLVSLAAVLLSYLTVALNHNITRVWQRVFALVPLSVALGFTIMLLTLSWQGYSNQPFGERGASIIFLVLLLIVAAVLSFFVRDGVPALVFTIWFLGVAQQQWGDNAVISLSAIVAVVLSAAIAALGFILAVESHRPSLTTQISKSGGRVRFFGKSEKTPSSELP